MALTTDGADEMLDALGVVSTYLGLLDSGVELSGGSPAYARQAVTWGAASAGSMAMSGTEQFDIPAGSEVNQVGLYSASSAGTLYGTATLTSEVYGAQGLYNLTALTVTQS